MEQRIRFSPSGLVLDIDAEIVKEDVPTSAIPFYQVAFDRFASLGVGVANYDYEASFSWCVDFVVVRQTRVFKRTVKETFLDIVGNRVHPSDIDFLTVAFFDYNYDLLNFVPKRGCKHVKLFARIVIPSAAAADPHIPLQRAYRPDVAAADSSTNVGDQPLLTMEEAFERFINKPANPSAVQSLKRSVVVDPMDSGHGEISTCAICKKDFETSQVLCWMPCDHEFHSACLEELLKRSHRCPICRVAILSV